MKQEAGWLKQLREPVVVSNKDTADADELLLTFNGQKELKQSLHRMNESLKKQLLLHVCDLVIHEPSMATSRSEKGIMSEQELNCRSRTSKACRARDPV